MIVDNALGLIENTPLIELKNIYDGPGSIFAKAEFIQPGGSVKDRAALHMIRDAYQQGKLVKGQSVVEMTSGNMGAGLAVVCNQYGNPFIAVMSSGNSPQRVKMMESLGARVDLVPQVDGIPGQVTGSDIDAATVKAITLANDMGAFYVDQFNNPSCVDAHFNGTGPEIWQDLGSKMTAFVAAVGTGGTFVGTSGFIKQQNNKVCCVAVEPQGSEVLAGKPITNPKHNMQGIGYGLIVPHWDTELVDRHIAITSEEAETYRKLLAEKESLHVGFSAGANVCACIKLIESGVLGKNPVIATILCDSGLKY